MGTAIENHNEIKKYPWLEIKLLIAPIIIFITVDLCLGEYSFSNVRLLKISIAMVLLFGAAVILLNIISLLLSLVVKLVLRKTALRVIFNNIASFVALVLIDVALAYASVEVLEHYL